MRNLVVVIAIVFTSLAASCTQHTCPTYTKGLNEAPQEQQVEAKEDKRV